MKERLKTVISYKTAGKRSKFAAMLGWSPQYLTNLLNGSNFGLQPVITILKTFPEIQARWFLLGEGDMLDASKLNALRCRVYDNIQAMLDIDCLVPVMSADQLRQLENSIIKLDMPVLSHEMLSKLHELVNERNNKIEAKFAEATAKSEELCKQKTAKK